MKWKWNMKFLILLQRCKIHDAWQFQRQVAGGMAALREMSKMLCFLCCPPCAGHATALKSFLYATSFGI